MTHRSEHSKKDAGARTSLGDDVVSGLRWVAAAYYLNVTVRLGISVTLARLLTPAEFGVMALAMAVVGALMVVQDSGFSTALVRHPGDVRRAAAGVCIVSVCLAAMLGAAMCLVAPAVTTFFGHAELLPVLRVLALLLVLRAAGNASRALLQRGMRFKETATIDVVATAVYAIVGVGLAATGHGVWSLVYAQLAADAGSSAAAFARAPLRLALDTVDPGVLRDLARFGRHIVAANVLGMLHLQLPAMVVGKLLGAPSLGLYEMAVRWAWMPVQGITHVAGRVAYPAFASLRDQLPALADGYMRAFKGVLFLTLPAAVGLALVARPLIRTLYGSEWEGAIGPLRVLAFMGLFHALAATTGEVFKAVGRPAFISGFALFYNTVLAASLYLLGLQSGLMGVAVATLLAPLATAVIAIVTVTRLLPVRRRALARIVGGAGGATVVMAAAVLAALAVTDGVAPPIALVLALVVGMVAYLIVVRATEPGLVGDVLAAVGLRGVLQAASAAIGRVPFTARARS